MGLFSYDLQNIGSFGFVFLLKKVVNLFVFLFKQETPLKIAHSNVGVKLNFSDLFVFYIIRNNLLVRSVPR